MAGNGNLKLKTLYIKDFLERKTDEGEGVSVEDIISYFGSLGMTAERKSIYSDIELLRCYGMDIESVRGKRTEYRLMSREFQLPELKLLVDAVGSSKFITRKKSLALIKKLSSLTSEREARELQRNVYVDRRVKMMNESIYYTVDAIHTAINTDSKLSFKYFDYAPDKQRVLRREGGRYTVSPLSLNYAEENYYLFGYSDGVRTYRVDRMAEASVLNEPRVSNSETCAFDPAVCSLEMFSMYSGEHRNVDMLFENSLSTVAIDRFGADVAMRPQDDGHFSLTAGVMISPNFLAWVFSFAGRVKILSPQDVLERYRQLAQLACSE